MKRLSDIAMLAFLSIIFMPIALSFFPVLRQVGTPLLGVVETHPNLEFSLHRFLNGEFQKAVSDAVTGRVPFYAPISRSFNQAKFSLLNLSSNDAILSGRNGYLLHSGYTSLYCHRDLANSLPAMQKQIKMIKEIQEAVERRGQAFLYVLTPSKIEHLPAELPRGYPCASKDRDQFVPAWVKYLANSGIRYVDGTSNLASSEAEYGYEAFPRGGIHWTELSAHAAVNRIIEALNVSSGTQILQPFDLVIEEEGSASHENQDLASLLNTLWLPRANKTALVTGIRAIGPNDCSSRHARIAAVGGSFFTAIGRSLMRNPCQPQLMLLSYLTLSAVNFNELDKAPSRDVDYTLLDQADVIILEDAGVLLDAPASLRDLLVDGQVPARTRAF